MKKGFFLTILLVVSLILFNSFILEAQIVDIESKRLQKKEDGWHGNIALNFNLAKNTSIVGQLGNTIRTQYNFKKHTFLFYSILRLLKSDNKNLVNNGMEHLRYNYALGTKETYVFEAFDQIQYDQLRKISVRSLRGVGARAKFVENDSTSIFFGTLAIYENEHLTDGTHSNSFRFSSYLSLDIQFNKLLGINTITYYQPNMLFINDYRISHKLTVRVKINDRLNVNFMYDILHDNKPPTEVPKTFFNIRNGLNYKFG